MEAGLILAQLAVAVGTGVIVSGVIMALGGLGVLRTFNQRLSGTADALERLEGRFDRHTKVEASSLGVARRQSERDLKTDAQQRLAETNRRPDPSQRPKVVG